MNNENTHDEVIPTDEEGNPLKRQKTATRSDEEVISLEEEGNPKETIKKLREELRKCVEEKQEYLTGWQRAKADFINARKRDEESQKEFLKFAKQDIVVELLPVLQSFDMAIGNKEAWEKADKNWRTGVEYIYTQMKQILEAQGLKEVNPLGLDFDPLRDEAIEYVPVEKEVDHNKIVSVIQKGYLFNGKSVQPPRVTVGEFKKS
ncbi:MAG TPA: nucleotide exchange factor GrpE [Candidatus Paceibacterota bacterium]